MKELNDDEIRVIGNEYLPVKPNSDNRPANTGGHKRTLRSCFWGLLAMMIVLIILAFWWRRSVVFNDNAPVLFDSSTVVVPSVVSDVAMDGVDDNPVGVTLRDTLVNDIPLTIYSPHHLHASLHVGPMPAGDQSAVMMALQAADVRADNLEIVSAFVHHGELLSRGTAKQGFCAIIGDSVVIGVDEATPYFERAISQGGDFFRQYPLVAHRQLVENRIKTKAVRRALACIGGRVVVVATATRESLHDFSQALVDLGAETAINLVGSQMTSGWINVGDSVIFPERSMPLEAMPPLVNYIVWSK